MNIYNLLNQCRTPTLTKQLLSGNKDMPYLKEYLKAMLDTGVTYGIKEIPEYTTELKPKYDCTSDIIIALDRIKLLSGKDLKEDLGYFYSRCTPEIKKMLTYAIKRKHPNKIGIKVVNQVFPGLIFQVPYQGCLPATPENLTTLSWSDGVAVQKKEDGMAVLGYVNYTEAKLYTRQHKEITHAFPEVCRKLVTDFSTLFRKEELPDYLHMEFTVWKDDKILARKQGNGILNKIIKGSKKEANYDIRPIMLDLNNDRYFTQINRYTRMKYIYQSFNIVEQYVCYNLKDADRIAQKFIKLGYEGAVYKNTMSSWVDGKHKHCLKVKPFADIELLVVGWKPHKEKKNQIGSLICISRDNLLRVAVSGLSDEQRCKDYADWYYEIITVRANDIITSKSKDTVSLLNPRFIEIRYDKFEADSLSEIENIFNGLRK